MQPGDLTKVISVSDPAMAPDGATVAVVVGRIDADANQARAAIWTVDVAKGSTRSVTSGDVADSQPRWSPDGRQLAFARTVKIGDRPETSVRVLPVDLPGEPRVVATTTEAVRSLCWSPGGDRLAWCARVPEVDPATPDRDRPPRRITTFLSRLDDVGWVTDRRSQVFVAPADGSAPARAVTSGPFEHQSVAWSPDGTTLVVAAGRHEGWDLDDVVDLWLVDLPVDEDDPLPEPRRLTDGTWAWSNPSWSPHGGRIAATGFEPSLGWRNPRLAAVDVVTGAVTDLAVDLDRNFAPYPGARPPVWEGDGAVIASVEDRGGVVVVRVAADGTGAVEPLGAGDRCAAGFDAVNGLLAAVVATPDQPAELEVGGLRTTFCSAFLADVPPRPTTRFGVPSPAGDGDIDAWLITPEGFDPDSTASSSGPRWPLLLLIHGGPMTQFGERWFDEFQLLAGAGFVVVGANPHGSSGREEAWGRAIRSPKAAIDPGTGWGGIDAEDLLAVVDATLERWPALDPDRVGVLGGSYGGFMTTLLLGRTDRFAAGCSERAVNNLLSEEWSADVGGSFHRELGVSHLDDPDEYVRMSPVTYARDITAPVLILHSEQDLRCPTEQADALFVALRLLGHPDVEYWRFPGEGHEMSRSGSPSHRIRRAEIIIDFFSRTIAAGPR